MRQTFRIEPTSHLELRVRFPIGKFTENLLDEIPENLRGRFTLRDCSALEISLHDGVFVEVDGFGLPFHNPGHVTDDWINKGSVVADSMTFIDILRQRKWHIIVKHPYKYFGRLWEETMVPAPFTFPYGDEHWFDLTRYETQFQEAISKGSQFPLSVNFPDTSSMQSVTIQLAVQDCLWIATEVAKIFAKKHPAYFIPTRPDAVDPSKFFAVLSMKEKYCKDLRNVWSSLTKDEFVQLAFHDDMSPMETPSLHDHRKWHKLATSVWNAKIIEKATNISALKDHHLTKFDLLLLVQQPREFKDLENIKTFPTRKAANQEMGSWNSVSLLFDSQLSDLERKVKAVNQYTSPAPSHLGGWEFLENGVIPPSLKSRMVTHASFQLGRGFLSWWHATVRRPDDAAMTADGRFIRRIHEWNVPTVSVLDLEDRLLHCLMEEILEEDRDRFRQYMGHLPVGFGIINAVSGWREKILGTLIRFCSTAAWTTGVILATVAAVATVDTVDTATNANTTLQLLTFDHRALDLAKPLFLPSLR